MHLGRTRVEEHRHELARRVAAHDRVVDDDDPPSCDLVERVELEPDSLFPHRLIGLDERPRDVAVLDQRLAEGDAGRLGVSDRSRCAGVRDADDEVGLDGSLLGQPFAHPNARAVHLDAAQP